MDISEIIGIVIGGIFVFGGAIYFVWSILDELTDGNPWWIMTCIVFPLGGFAMLVLGAIAVSDNSLLPYDIPSWADKLLLGLGACITGIYVVLIVFFIICKILDRNDYVAHDTYVDEPANYPSQIDMKDLKQKYEEHKDKTSKKERKRNW